MGAEVLIPPGSVVPRIAIEIAEAGRQAVGPMLPRSPTERPPGILHFERDEALAHRARHGRAQPASGQSEVIEPMIERHASDGDPKLTHVGEAGQPDLAHFVGLAEDHLCSSPWTAAKRGSGAPACGEFLSRVQGGVAGSPRRSQSAARRGGLQPRRHLRLKQTGQGTRLATPRAPFFRDGRRDPSMTCSTTPWRRPRADIRRYWLEPHMVIGNVSAWQAIDSSRKNHLHNQPPRSPGGEVNCGSLLRGSRQAWVAWGGADRGPCATAPSRPWHRAG
ncbi:hypothetical protein ACVWXM_009700 [Bradyrhizobium sp. GM7.3]